jgi:hypothetical protein
LLQLAHLRMVTKARRLASTVLASIYELRWSLLTAGRKTTADFLWNADTGVTGTYSVKGARDAIQQLMVELIIKSTTKQLLVIFTALSSELRNNVVAVVVVQIASRLVFGMMISPAGGY